MAKIDKVKELIGFLKMIFAIMVGLMASTAGALIAGEYDNNITLYWASITFLIMLFFGIMGVAIIIAKEIKKLEDM